MSRAPQIIVTKGGPDAFLVDVQAQSVTKHQVAVRPEYLRDLEIDDFPLEKILVVAFGFLLEREPNTAILRKFDLGEIERYFPEFREEIGRRLRA